jgi:hypothetical protein
MLYHYRQQRSYQLASKITSPHKSQQIRVGSNILVSGISSPPPGVSHTGYTVSVLLNDVKPYQKAVAMGHGGKGDYSVWHYNITHKYAFSKSLRRFRIRAVHYKHVMSFGMMESDTPTLNKTYL